MGWGEPHSDPMGDLAEAVKRASITPSRGPLVLGRWSYERLRAQYTDDEIRAAVPWPYVGFTVIG